MSNSDKPKKIIRVISRLNIGGPAIHVVLLTQHFNNESWSSILVTGKHGQNEGDMSYLTAKYGVQPVYYPELGREISLLSDLKVCLSLIRLFIKEKPDIVHTHTAKAGFVGRVAAILTGVPQIYHTFHGHVFNGYFSPLKTKLYILIERFLALFTTRIVVISELQRQDLIGYGIAKERKFKVIPLGFDFGRILPPDSTNKLRYDLGLPTDIPVVAIIGRIVPIKNHSLFIQVAELVAKQVTDIHFLIIGDGELRDTCEKQVRDLGLESRVSFTGFLTDLQLVYGCVDVVVLTSINEGTPVSLLEAMACQKLVLSTRVGGVGDFVTNGVNGYVLEPNPQAFADIIIDYAINPDRYTPLKERASKDVLRKYDKERLFRDIEALYTE